MFVHRVNLNKMENASICHHVKQDFHGTERLVPLYHVHQVLRFQAHVAVAKPLFLHVHKVHIGMDIDAFILPISAQLV